MKPPVIRHLGRVEYLPTFERMRAFTLGRDADTADELWVLEHPPVFTQGQAGRPEHVLAPGEIPVVQTDRGGQVTYHGPGQIVIYPLLDLSRLGYGIRSLVTRLEQGICDALGEFGIAGAPRRDAPGVYVGEAKIASLGLRVRHARCYHGIALNVDLDLEPFSRINPCGYQGMRMTRMADFVPGIRPATVEPVLVRCLLAALDLPQPVETPFTRPSATPAVE